MPRKAKKIVVPPQNNVPQIDMETASVATKIAALMSLQNSEGWALILQVMNDNKAYLEQLIIEAFDKETGNDLTPQQQDGCRYKLKLIKELIDTPNNLIKILETSSDEKMDFDPYAHSK